MALVKIADVATKAQELGFKVIGGYAYLNLWYPKNDGPTSILHNGSWYSTADIVMHDRSIGYGYNDAFYGPFHDGYVQETEFGYKKFQEYLKNRFGDIAGGL